MFFIKELTHTILLHPSYFGPRMLSFLESKLYADVEGTCSGQFGYIIAVVSILDIGKGMVLSGSGQAEFITRYRAIVFKPFKGEVVDGVVNNVNKMGFFADVGPLNVFVSHQLIHPDMSRMCHSAAHVLCLLPASLCILYTKIIEKNTRIRLKIVGTRVDATEIFAIGTIKEDHLGTSRLSPSFRRFIHLPTQSSMASTSPVFKIAPTTQEYDWGKVGRSAKVAQFAAASKLPGFAINDSATYAELWMGTHPKSPSHVFFSGEVLSKHLASHPELVGERVAARFDASNGNLPFLFKVLSIEKALSIQSHPDKATAEKLHAEHPDIYKDPNHKPEMTIAITPFRAMCGFRPLYSIATSLKSTPEFAALIPETIREAFISLSDSDDPTGPAEKAALKDLFAAVMTAEESIFKPQLEALVKRYTANQINPNEGNDLAELVLRLNSQFPGDIGVFCAFLLNYITLNPGDAIFLGAGEPHAYVSGECMECMANSDNVIRAGLTPKLRDIPNLVSGLTYSASEPAKHVVVPSPFSDNDGVSTLYEPPVPEFSVVQVKLGAGKEEAHRAVNGPSIAIITGGSGAVQWGHENSERLDVGFGDVFFIGAGTEVSLRAGGGEDLVVYRAFVQAD
ncbi:hypothetical protein D9615_006550 [Tricholomella constricta]|uniref:Mannose-6-phosphate isomerase n=1 Tax=Tricholomella constricta TaxID=117010 RepID=A0A8H5H9L1_9AGAR|nr:hypothetical protein D9615_006550 [Tricholomella constricta]